MPVYTDPFLSHYHREPSSSPPRVADPNAFWGLASPDRIPATKSHFISPFPSLSSPQRNNATLTPPNAHPKSPFPTDTPSRRYLLSSPYHRSPYWHYSSYRDFLTQSPLLSLSPNKIPNLDTAPRFSSPLRTTAPPPDTRFLTPTPPTAARAWSPFLPATDPVLRLDDAARCARASPLSPARRDPRARDLHRTSSPASLDEYAALPDLPQTPLKQRLERAALYSSSPLTPMDSPLPPADVMLGPIKGRLKYMHQVSPSSSNTSIANRSTPPVHAQSYARDDTGKPVPAQNGVREVAAFAPRETRRTRVSRVPAASGPPTISRPSQRAETEISIPSAPPSVPPSLKKRRRQPVDNPPPKRARLAPKAKGHAPTSTTHGPSRASLEPPLKFTNRTLPSSTQILPQFPRFYRNFPACSFISSDRSEDLCPNASKPEGNFNPPRNLLDLYQPRFTKGISKTKIGMCPICAEATNRGGEGKKVWLAMKQSAYNYHMMYYHGLSPVTGLPFSPPTEFRTAPHQPKSRVEKNELLEGKCHKCTNWVPVETVKKDHDTKVKEHFWWKHAAACHGDSRSDDDTNVFVDDDVYRTIQARMEQAEGGQAEQNERALED